MLNSTTQRTAENLVAVAAIALISFCSLDHALALQPAERTEEATVANETPLDLSRFMAGHVKAPVLRMLAHVNLASALIEAGNNREASIELEQARIIFQAEPPRVLGLHFGPTVFVYDLRDLWPPMSIAMNLVRIGEGEKALRFARGGKVNEASCREYALWCVGSEFAARGEVKRALEIADETDAIEEETGLTTIAEAVQLSIIEKKFKSTGQVVSLSELSPKALTSLSFTLPEAFLQIVKAAEAIKAPGVKAQCLVDLALIDFRRGNKESAVKLLNKAGVLIPTIQDKPKQSDCFSKLAMAQITVGEKQQAAESVKSVLNMAMKADVRTKTSSLSQIAFVQAMIDREGALLSAKQALKCSKELLPTETGFYLYDIAIAFAVAGDIEKALDVAQHSHSKAMIPNPQTDIPPQRAIVVALCKIGDFKPALQVAEAMSDPAEKATALMDISAAQLSTGDQNESLHTLEMAVTETAKIEDANLRGYGLSVLSLRLATVPVLDGKQMQHLVPSVRQIKKSFVPREQAIAKRLVELANAH